MLPIIAKSLQDKKMKPAPVQSIAPTKTAMEELLDYMNNLGLFFESGEVQWEAHEFPKLRLDVVFKNMQVAHDFTTAFSAHATCIKKGYDPEIVSQPLTLDKEAFLHGGGPAW